MRRKQSKATLERNCWDGAAADRVIAIIRHGLRSDVWRDDLLEAHFQLAYHFAQDENERIDSQVEMALNHSIRPPAGSIASRIIAARRLSETAGAAA